MMHELPVTTVLMKAQAAQRRSGPILHCSTRSPGPESESDMLMMAGDRGRPDPTTGQVAHSAAETVASGDSLLERTSRAR